MRVTGSWLDHAQQNAITNPSERLRRIDNLNDTGFIGHDLDVFRGLGYGSLRLLTFGADDDVVRLIYFARDVRAFSPAEDRFLLVLAFAANFAFNLARAVETPAQT